MPQAKNVATLPPPAALLAVINELVALMAEEAGLVMGRKFDAHRALLKRKQKLTLEYRAGIKAIAAQPDLVKHLPDDLRRKLKAGAQKLAESVDQNARLLRSTVTATQQLIQNIVSIVRSEVMPKLGYHDPRTAHLELGNYSPTCAPVAVRRSV